MIEGLYSTCRKIRIDGLKPRARELLDRYNVAQAQSLLNRCVDMPSRRAQTFRYRELSSRQAYRLFPIKGNPVEGYEVRLDGPVSMFHRSQKYGVQMAVFLPALLTCKGWRMRAEIVSKTSGRAFFEMNSNQNQLRSHYLSAPAYENPVLEKLETAWERSDTSWSLEPSSEVIDLGESAFIPDFLLRHPDGRQVYLEVLGFWTPPHLKARLEEFEHGRSNFHHRGVDELRAAATPAKLPPNVSTSNAGSTRGSGVGIRQVVSEE